MIQLFMLDTNTVSFIISGKSPLARSRLAALSVDEVACISAITEGELLFGLAKIGAGEDRRRAVEHFLLRMQVLPWGREEASVYGPLRAKQQVLGKTLGPLDTQIAAHAVSVGAVLVTNDLAFQQVPDLPGIQTWATDR